MDVLTPVYELPSIDSPKKNERISARQLRLRQRLEKHNFSDEDFPKKLAAFEDYRIIGPKEICKTQLDESGKRVEKHLNLGRENVTNFSVAIDADEIDFKVTADHLFNDYEDIEKEVKEVENVFKQFRLAWKEHSEAEGDNCSLKLKKLVDAKMWECEKILSEKDDIIKRYCNKIKQRSKNLKTIWHTYYEDVFAVTERINNAANTFYQISQEELKFACKTLGKERTGIMDLMIDKLKQKFLDVEENWVGNYEEQNVKMENFVNSRVDKFQSTHPKLHPKRLKCAEEIHQLKFKLWQAENTILENYVRLKRGRKLMNLNWEERCAIKNEMEKNEVGLTDRKRKLEKELARVEAIVRMHKRPEEDRRLNEDPKEILRKSDNLHRKNLKVFENVLHQSRKDIKQTFRRLLDIDRIIHTEMLQIPWSVPGLEFSSLEKAYILPEETRLMRLFDRFTLAPENIKAQDNSDSNIQKQDTESSGTFFGNMQTSVDESKFFLPLSAPIDLAKIVSFICNTLSFLPVEQNVEFVEKNYSEANIFLLCQILFPIIGVTSVDQLKLFIACVLDRTRSKNAKLETVITRRMVLEALDDYEKLCSSKKKANNEIDSALSILIDNDDDKVVKNYYESAFPKVKEFMWDKLQEYAQRYIWAMLRNQTLKEKVKSETERVYELCHLLGRKTAFKASNRLK